MLIQPFEYIIPYRGENISSLLKHISHNWEQNFVSIYALTPASFSLMGI